MVVGVLLSVMNTMLKCVSLYFVNKRYVSCYNSLTVTRECVVLVQSAIPLLQRVLAPLHDD